MQKIAISKIILQKILKKMDYKFLFSKKISFIRSMYDCIISTSKSINEDNSLLNCRIEGLENKSPDLVILDRNLKLKKEIEVI